MTSLEELQAAQLRLRLEKVRREKTRRKTDSLSGKTLQERGKEAFGFKDFEHRSTFLPLGQTAEGNLELATPGVFKEMAESFLLPGHAAQGGAYTPEDTTGFALDFLVPSTSGRLPGNAPAARVPRKEFVSNAPSTEDLRAQGQKFKSAASASGVRVNPDSYTDLMAGLETSVRMNRLNPRLHPGSSAVFDELSKAVGQDLDIDDLQILRRLVGTALRSTDPNLADDRRIAGLMQNTLDDYVDNLKPGDVVAGDPSRAGANLREFRALWSRSKKSEVIEDIIERAQRQPSGFENGIKIGFNSLINRKGGLRGFSDEEVVLINEIAKGGSKGQKLMKMLGKLSFGTRGGSNFLGGSIGMAGGSAAGSAVGGSFGGSVGMALAPTVGLFAQRGAEKAALDNAMLARAMVATGRKSPDNSLSVNALRRLLEKGAGPVANTLAPQIDPYDPNIL